MPPTTGRKSGDGVQAVVLALNMLEFIAASHRAVGVTELAREFETTKSRIYRHLRTLVSAGYLTQEPESERYRASARLMALGQSVSEGHEITAVARPAMRELRDGFGHSVALSVPENAMMRIIGTMPGTSQVEMGVKPGSLLSLHGSAQGKVALAFGDEGLMRALMQAPLARFTPKTITDPVDLAADIRDVRRKGWATAYDEALIGLNALAVPIYDARGSYVASIALVDSVQFIPAEPPQDLIGAVRAAGQRISSDLGFRPDQPRL